MNQPLHGAVTDGQGDRIGLVIILGHLTGFAAKKLHDGVVAEVQFPGLLQVHDTRQGNDTLDGGLVCCQAEGELSPAEWPIAKTFAESRL